MRYLLYVFGVFCCYSANVLVPFLRIQEIYKHMQLFKAQVWSISLQGNQD